MGMVKVTNEQAKSLENVQNKENFIKEYLDGYFDKADNDILLKLSFDDFIKALYIDYEIEQTPEEKLNDYYYHKTTPFDQRRGVDFTLSILGITVKGINDSFK